MDLIVFQRPCWAESGTNVPATKRLVPTLGSAPDTLTIATLTEAVAALTVATGAASLASALFMDSDLRSIDLK